MKVFARIRWVVCLLATLAVACSLWAASLVVCPKCGYESDNGAVVCSHCGAALPVPKVAGSGETAASNANAQAASLDTVSALALTAARVDQRLAEENRKDRPELAYAFYENILALSRLIRREGVSPDAGKVLAENLERCRDALTHGMRTCPACNGSGKRNVHFQQLAGDKSTQVSEGLVCSTCNGAGVVRMVRTTDSLRLLMAQGRRDFETRAKALGRVACGRAWLPQELAAKLDVRAQALVCTACPTPCPDCMGMGVQDCARCKGSGRVPCTNNGCKDGWIVHQELNTLSTKASSISRREVCPVCQGTGQMACPDCRGDGTIPCKTCHGTGRNAVCQDCGGQGWTACPRCHGTGKLADGAICPDCLGQHERICPKCHGEGCAVR